MSDPKEDGAVAREDTHPVDAKVVGSPPSKKSRSSDPDKPSNITPGGASLDENVFEMIEKIRVEKEEEVSLEFIL